MARRVAGLSLIELTFTIALLGMIAVPLSGVVFEQSRASVQMDSTVAAVNLARYEHELFQVRSTTQNWCSVPNGALPASDPDKSACPGAVTNPNPYGTFAPFVVYRINAAQTPTDGSSGLTRVTVKVKRVVQRNGFLITALEPVVSVVTYLASGVTFGP